MPNSLRAKISSLRYKGKITEEEYKDLISKLDGHDKALRTPWIPCSERLPEYEERVLLSCENGDVFVGYLDRHTDFKAKQGGFELIYINKWWDYADDYDFEFDEITAWQPLPEPYKAESEDNNGTKHRENGTEGC